MATFERKEQLSGERTLYTGFFLGQVKSINPTTTELAALIGYEPKADAVEIKYEGKTKVGQDEYVSLHFWLQAENEAWFNAKNMLIDKDVVFKESGKTQYVNEVLGSFPVDDKKNLPEWFTHYQVEHKPDQKWWKEIWNTLIKIETNGKTYVNVADKEYRKAIQGEANLYNFLKAWFNGIDLFSPNTKDVWIEIKKAFRNIDKYAADIFGPFIKSELAYADAQSKCTGMSLEQKKAFLSTFEKPYTDKVIGLATVSTSEDGTKHYQQVHNDFLPGWMWPKLQQALKDGKWSTNKQLENYYKQLTGPYAPKDAFSIGLLSAFDPSAHVGANNVSFKDETGEKATSVPADTSY